MHHEIKPTAKPSKVKVAAFPRTPEPQQPAGFKGRDKINSITSF